MRIRTFVRALGRALVLGASLSLAAAARLGAQAASPAPADSGRIVAFVHWERQDRFVVGSRQPTAGAFTPIPIANATAMLQGEKTVLGTSRADGYMELTPLAAGRHRLVFTSDGHRTLQCRVEVAAGKSDTVQVRMIPTKDVPGFNNNAFGCRQPR